MTHGETPRPTATLRSVALAVGLLAPVIATSVTVTATPAAAAPEPTTAVDVAVFAVG